jgi:virginiamycin B lyase
MKRFLALFALLVMPSVLQAQDSVTKIDEWLVPWEDSRPRDPYVDQQGRVWFVGQVGNYVAYLDPASGQFKRYELDANTLPHNLIVAEDGYVWYAGNAAGHIGKLDPATGEITKYPMPDPAIRDPHTLTFTKSGDIWFTAQSGNVIGRLTTATGKIDLITVPTQRARPYGIKLDAQDRPWVVLFGTNKLATVNPQTLQLETVDIPRAEARPRRMELTADGNIWYVDYAGGMLGRYNPQTRQFKEWMLPGGEGARPYGTASDDQGRIWIAETGSQPNRIVGFDPETEQFFGMSTVPSGGGTVRHMYFHPTTKEIWFGADTNYIGRARPNTEAL